MNSKEKLIRIILNLSDEAAGLIVGRITHMVSEETMALPNEKNAGLVLNSVFAAAKEFDESKHPRAADGRWTSGAPGYMKRKDAERWEKTGRMSVSPKRFPDVLDKINREKHEIEKWEGSSSSVAEEMIRKAQSRLASAQREMAEKMREFKHEKREKIEGRSFKAHNDRLVKEYRDLEEEIDYMQEKYADRESGSLTDLKWPKGKRGEKAKAKYEEMLKRRDELHVEIDWDRVEDEQE